MTTLHQWLISQRRKSCEWCAVAVMISLIALVLGFVHLFDHP
jgi:uncharacterized membrane protein